MGRRRVLPIVAPTPPLSLCRYRLFLLYNYIISIPIPHPHLVVYEGLLNSRLPLRLRSRPFVVG